MASAKNSVEVLFNGPALAGIGATTDAGLVPSKFHVLPWDPKDRSSVDIKTKKGVLSYDVKGPGHNLDLSSELALQYAFYNVDHVYAIPAYLSGINAMSDAEKEILRRDMIAIIFLMTAYGYYDGECREASPNEDTAARAIQIDDSEAATILNVEALNRAATFILARMHTKYQTNHVLGGTPMQASMASAVRAFYSISSAGTPDNSVKARLSAYAACLHWALHPANERLLIPLVINNSQISTAYIHKNGPEVTMLEKEEYFTIRSNTPPASTHHFYVAAAAVQHLEPLGILSYMPTINQMKDIQTGWLLIEAHGARLHPAARHWGLTRITANQKIVEPVCADLGYAVRKLMPMSSLALSPILRKEDSLNATWKRFIDALRAAMDKQGEEMLDTDIFSDIKASIMPEKKDDTLIKAVKKLLIKSLGDDDEDMPTDEHKRDDDDDTTGPSGDIEDLDDDDDDDEDSDHGDSGAQGAKEEEAQTVVDQSFRSAAPQLIKQSGKKGKARASDVSRQVQSTPGVLGSKARSGT